MTRDLRWARTAGLFSPLLAFHFLLASLRELTIAKKSQKYGGIQASFKAAAEYKVIHDRLHFYFKLFQERSRLGI